MNDYERIAKVIRHLDAHYVAQPDLASLAAQVGLSPFHFHRLFTNWAGITPKDFLQSLTLTHARELLRKGESVLKTTYATGLSGPGRLHDLCVSLEAASPREIKAGGQGWEIIFGFANTPFGQCIIGEGPRGICFLAFVEPGKQPDAQATLQNAWPAAKLTRENSVSERWATTIFHRTEPRSVRSPLRVMVQGTTFQIRVWTALLRIPVGVLVSYGQIAQAIGHPRAVRAVGTAVGHNTLAYLIPCHRVIRETGLLGGYRWGLPRKQAMLAWETAGSR